MTVYGTARETIERAEQAAADTNENPEQVIEALLVIAIERLTAMAGSKRVEETLTYELANLGGTIDTVFLRSR